MLMVNLILVNDDNNGFGNLDDDNDDGDDDYDDNVNGVENKPHTE